MDIHFPAPTDQSFYSLEPTSNRLGCKHCRYLTKHGNAKPKILKRQTERVFCEIPECASSFGRPSDLVRHWKSVHGPKQQCMVRGCGYATARRDKMAEHVRKKHQKQNASSISTPSCKPESTSEVFKAMEQWEAVEEWNYLFGNELDALALFSPSDVVPYVNGVMAGNEHVDVGFGFNEILTSWLYGMQCIQ